MRKREMKPNRIGRHRTHLLSVDQKPRWVSTWFYHCLTTRLEQIKEMTWFSGSWSPSASFISGPELSLICLTRQKTFLLPIFITHPSHHYWSESLSLITNLWHLCKKSVLFCFTSQLDQGKGKEVVGREYFSFPFQKISRPHRYFGIVVGFLWIMGLRRRILELLQLNVHDELIQSLMCLHLQSRWCRWCAGTKWSTVTTQHTYVCTYMCTYTAYIYVYPHTHESLKAASPHPFPLCHNRKWPVYDIIVEGKLSLECGFVIGIICRDFHIKMVFERITI